MINKTVLFFFSVIDDPQISNIDDASNNNLTSLKGKFCLFGFFFVPLDNSYGDVTIDGEGLQI